MAMTLTRIRAKFPGKCAASGYEFAAGAEILHNAATRRCYLPAHAPDDATVVEVVAGAKSAAYRAGWDAGAPGAPLSTNPHAASTAEFRMWLDGLRDRHASRT